MTDKHSFLERLKAALATRGISEADGEQYLAQFDRYYERMANDDLATAETLLDIESIADNIYDQISQRYDDIDRLAAQTMSINTLDVDNEPTTEAQIPVVADDADGYEMLEISEDDELVAFEEYAEQVLAEPSEETSTRLPDYVEEEKIQENKMFWLLLALSLPITLPLALIVLGVFGVMWGALAGVMVGAIAALIAVVCVGTVLSLVGIIYGIIQISSALPVGLYEIGVGVAVAGVTMCIGILIYNFAIRLVPIFFKLVWKLFKYVLGRLKELFNYLRKESAKL